MTSPGRYPLRSRTSSAWRLCSMVCSFTFIRPRLPLRASSRSFSFCSASAMRRLISACRRALFANSSSASTRCCASAASMDDEKVAPPRLSGRRAPARARPWRVLSVYSPTLWSTTPKTPPPPRFTKRGPRKLGNSEFGIPSALDRRGASDRGLGNSETRNLEFAEVHCILDSRNLGIWNLRKSIQESGSLHARNLGIFKNLDSLVLARTHRGAPETRKLGNSESGIWVIQCCKVAPETWATLTRA
jgi:hypothetical protein